MKKFILFLIFLCGIYQYQFAQVFEFNTDQVKINYEKFVLPNGVKLLVHQDHKAPIVAVNVWCHVGSKNDNIG